MTNDPDQIARIEAYLSENLSPARFRHVMGVREVALTLAKRHGIDPAQAALAALLHASVKERPDDELLAVATRAGRDGRGGSGGRRLVAMSCSGGEASVVADRAESMNLDFPAFDDDHAVRITDTLSDLVAVSNPLDYHTFIWGDRERLSATFTAVLDGPLDAAMLVLDFPSAGLDGSGWWPTLGAFADAGQATGTPGVVVASMAENLPPEVEAAADEAGLVAVRGIGEARTALEASAWWGGRQDRPPLLVADPFDPTATRTLYEVEA